MSAESCLIVAYYHSVNVGSSNKQWLPLDLHKKKWLFDTLGWLVVPLSQRYPVYHLFHAWSKKARLHKNAPGRSPPWNAQPRNLTYHNCNSIKTGKTHLLPTIGYPKLARRCEQTLFRTRAIPCAFSVYRSTAIERAPCCWHCGHVTKPSSSGWHTEGLCGGHRRVLRAPVCERSQRGVRARARPNSIDRAPRPFLKFDTVGSPPTHTHTLNTIYDMGHGDLSIYH